MVRSKGRLKKQLNQQDNGAGVPYTFMQAPPSKDGPFTLLLEAEVGKIWRKLKDKFKYSNDSLFLFFLLDLGERELLWRRRQKLQLKRGRGRGDDSFSDCDTSDVEESNPVDTTKIRTCRSRDNFWFSDENTKRKRKKEKIVAVRFKYLGDKNYEVTHGHWESKCLTDASDISDDGGNKKKSKQLINRSVNTETADIGKVKLAHVELATNRDQSRSAPKKVGLTTQVVNNAVQVHTNFTNSTIPCPPRKQKFLDRAGEFIENLVSSQTKTTTTLSNGHGEVPNELLQEFARTDYETSVAFSRTGKSAKVTFDTSVHFATEQSNILSHFATAGGTDFDAVNLPRDTNVLGYPDQNSADMISVLTGGQVGEQFTGATDLETPAISAFAADANLNSAFVHQFGGKLANMVTSDQMLVQFDGEQTTGLSQAIDSNSEFSPKTGSMHHFGGKGFPPQSSDLFLNSNDHHDSTSFLNFGSKGGLIGNDHASTFVGDHSATFPSSGTILPRFGEVGSVKTKFPGYHGKMLSVVLPKNVTDDPDESESHLGDFGHPSPEPAIPGFPVEQSSSTQALPSPLIGDQTFDLSSDVTLSSIQNSDVTSGKMRILPQSAIAPSADSFPSLENRPSSVQSEGSTRNMEGPALTPKPSSVSNEKPITALGSGKKNSVDVFIPEEVKSDWRNGDVLLKHSRSDNNTNEPLRDESIGGNHRSTVEPNFPDNFSDNSSNQDAPVPKFQSVLSVLQSENLLREGNQTIQGILPRFLGKAGSELMSVKFKSHLLAESLLGHREESLSHVEQQVPTEASCLPLSDSLPTAQMKEKDANVVMPCSSSEKDDEDDDFQKLVIDELAAPLDSTDETDDREALDSEIASVEVPEGFELRKVSSKCRLSLFSTLPIPRDTDIGPLEGAPVHAMNIPDDCSMRFIWLVGTEDDPKFLCTEDKSKSNWLRYMQPAESHCKANCLTHIIDGQIYFKTIRPVYEEDEMLYWTVDLCNKWSKKRLDKTSCGGCNIQFGHCIYYRLHCTIFHDAAYSLSVRKHYCKICGLSFVGKEKIGNHAATVHNGKGAYQCNFCSRYFLRIQYLETHRSYGCAMNPQRNKPRCDICGQSFSQPQKLQSHKRRMHYSEEEELKEFQCNECKKILGSSAGLVRHKKEVHGKVGEKCGTCGKILINKSNLKIHMLTHSRVRPFKCELENCSAAFTTKQGVQKHYRRVHSMNDLPAIKRSIEYTFDAYSGSSYKEQEQAEPGPVTKSSDFDENKDDNISDAASPLSVGCSPHLTPAPAPRPEECDSGADNDDIDDGNTRISTNINDNTEGNDCLSTTSRNVSQMTSTNTNSEGRCGKKWNYRDNSGTSLLVDEVFSAAEKDIIGKDMNGEFYPYISSPSIDEPKSTPMLRDAPRDYNISSLIRDSDADDNAELIDPGKDPQVSDYKGSPYREDARDDVGEYRRSQFYRRDGYDMVYSGEARNLSLKEKSLQLELPYKSYEGLDELDRIGRDAAGLEGLLSNDQNGSLNSRPLPGVLSPRYHPTYDAESMDLSLPRLAYPTSPIYPTLDLPSRFDLPSSRLVDLRNHLGLPTHRYTSPRISTGSPPANPYPVYQAPYATPPGRHSPSPSFHPYSTYY